MIVNDSKPSKSLMYVFTLSDLSKVGQLKIILPYIKISFIMSLIVAFISSDLRWLHIPISYLFRCVKMVQVLAIELLMN